MTQCSSQTTLFREISAFRMLLRVRFYSQNIFQLDTDSYRLLSEKGSKEDSKGVGKRTKEKKEEEEEARGAGQVLDFTNS